jgi:hypothetical protein
MRLEDLQMKTTEQLKKDAATADLALKQAFDAWTEVQRQLAAADPSAWVITHNYHTEETEVVPVRNGKSNDSNSLGYSPSMNGLRRFILNHYPGGEVPWSVKWIETPESATLHHPDSVPWYGLFRFPGAIKTLGEGHGVVLGHEPSKKEIKQFVRGIRKYLEDNDGYVKENVRWSNPIIEERR